MQCNSEARQLLDSPVIDQDADTSSPNIPYVRNNFGDHSSVWIIVRGCMNSIAHMLLGASVFVSLWFSFKTTPITNFQIHIALSVIGYQLLMAHAILSLNERNAWSSQLSVAHRVKAHLVLQVVGSVLAIAGSAIMIKEKSVHFNSNHGKLALAALIFTCVSLVNGTISFFNVRRILYAKIVKINHILCGLAAFTLSSACLSLGFNKGSFKSWASDEMAIVLICITCTYTSIIICKPCCTFIQKFCSLFKLKIF